MIQVIVADDHELVRKGICALLNAAPDIEVIGEASDGQEAVELIEKKKPDVVIMDISMPRLDGIQATEKVSDKTAVVMLSMHEDDMIVRRVFQVGARGFILKRAVTEELLLAVRSAVRGESFLSPGISRLLLDIGNKPQLADTIFDVLTPREREVLQLIAEGNTNSEIAQILSISSKTVEKHRGRCMSKLGVNDLASLIRIAIKHRLVIIEDGR